ncbi:hypothetical protein POM88_019155 [Heracleum sosnowskyi]|uniref:Cation efflux protein transmembrane domain-containing protein n=1 Tax=Heracleum sosnowskyi TaxID=360622 RepID=A0AAD8N031_9APIA|nr:hypothetical protein POM88_019155 [Heracleum sosnowskyi]
MKFFDNLPTCIQGGVDPQAPFQLNISKISGSLAVGSSTFDSLLYLLVGGVLLNSRNAIVQAYAKDHYFDVVTNVIGLVAAVLGDGLYWWLDPIGAITLAVYTIWNWCGTVLENADIRHLETVHYTMSRSTLSLHKICH